MALLDHLKALAKNLAGLLTDDAVEVTGTNATDITDTTPQALIALEAGKELVITQLHIVNKTAAETPIIILEDTDAAELGRYQLGIGGVAPGTLLLDLHPPIIVPVGKGISAQASTATGDTRVTVRGFSQTPV